MKNTRSFADYVKANIKGDKLLNKFREQRDRYGSGANKRRFGAVLLPSLAAEVAQNLTDTNVGNVYAITNPSYKDDATLNDARIALSKDPFKEAQNQVLYEKNRRGQWINALHGNIFDAVGGKKKRLQKLKDDHVYLNKDGVSKLTKKQYINKLEGQVKDLNRQYKGNSGYLASSLGTTLNPMGFIGQAIGKRMAKKENEKLSQGLLSDDKYIKYLQNKKDDLYIKEAGSRNALKSSVLLPVIGTLPGYAIGKRVAKGDVKNDIKLHSRKFSLTPVVKNTLIYGTGGALLGGVGGHLYDRSQKKEGSWIDRNKGAISGALAGGMVGSTLGYFNGVKKKKELEDQLKQVNSQIRINKLDNKIDDHLGFYGIKSPQQVEMERSSRTLENWDLSDKANELRKKLGK